MSERTDADFLTDIQEAISRITKYTTGITYTEPDPSIILPNSLRGRPLQHA